MKNITKKLPYKEMLLFGILIFFLIIISLIARQYTPYIEEFLDIWNKGMIVYFIISILSVVLAPMNMLFLIPVATILWWPLITSILTILWWLTGAQIAYEITRKWKHILKKFISLERLHKLEKKMPHESLFLSIVALRVLIPVDILSYAIWFFTPIKRLPYFLSTLIWISPFAIIFSYIGAVSFNQQVILIIIWVILLVFSWRLLVKKNN